MGMDIPHLMASGMGGIRSAGDLVARMMYTKKMKLKDAKEYVAKVQTFLKDNADKIKEFAGENAAIATAVEAVTSINPANVVSGFLSAVDSTANSAKDAAVDAANQKVEEGKQAVQDKANEINDAAKQKVQETKDAAKQKANEAIDNAANDVKKGLGL